MKTRIRKVKSKKEMENLIDDYITTGYSTKSLGERSVNLVHKKYGGVGSHILILILCCWTFGIANVLWAIYNYYSNSEEVIIKVETD